MINNLRQAFISPVYEDADKTRTSRLLHGLIGILLAMFLIGTPVFMMSSPHYRTPIATGSGAVFMIYMLCLFVARKGYTHLSAWILLTTLWAADTILLTLTGEMGITAVPAYIALVIIAALTLNEWAALIAATVSVTTGFGIALLDMRGLLNNLAAPDPGLTTTILVVYNILAVLAVLVLALRDIRNVVMQLRKNELALAERNQELQTARDTLKQQIEERTLSTELARSEAEAANRALQAEVWRIAGLAELANTLRGIQDIPDLSRNVITMLCRYLDTQVGALYIQENNHLKLVASYAYSHRRRPQHTFAIGQGLVGQAALEKQPITLTRVPDGYMDIVSGLGHAAPREIIATPILYEHRTIGVVEIGTVAPLTPAQLAFIDGAMENIAVAFNTAQTRTRIDELLLETKQQAEELQVRE
ncbi:MAG: GAF domain-containing protein [Anaerolineae bacterium]|nr:GAF domain-containing protein [Anaerolineae bacterium]